MDIAKAFPSTNVTEILIWPDDPADMPFPRIKSPAEDSHSPGVVTHVDHPRLRIYPPAQSQPNGSAVLVMSGGGYSEIATGKESTPTCQWLQSGNVTGFELIYRFPKDGWPPEAPFADAQRAMRFIKYHAGDYSLDESKIGIVGFSAGGHLAGMTAVQPDDNPDGPHAPWWHSPIDPIDKLPARPATAGLIYPIISLCPPDDDTQTRRELVGDHPTLQDEQKWSVQTYVNQDTPRTFLAQAEDDPVSPIDNSLLMFKALLGAKVALELHVFPTGGHGWGLGEPGSLVSGSTLFLAWAKINFF